MTYSKIDYGHGGCGAANPAAFICPRLRLFKSAPGVPGMTFFCVEISGIMLILTTFVLREGMFHFFAGCGFKAEREAANPSS